MELIQLKLEILSEQGPVEIARFDGGLAVRTVVGREGGTGSLVLPSHAVSREHGEFVRVGRYWAYTDLESTNGSWINGERLLPHGIYLLRSGDLVQMADVSLKVTELDQSGAILYPPRKDLPLRVIVVLTPEGALYEHPVPEYGTALVIGGEKGQLQIPGVMGSLPALTIERKGMHTSALIGSGAAVVISGEQREGAVTLVDNQQISVGPYRLVYFDTASVVQSMTVTAPKAPLDRGVGTSGAFLNKPSQGTLFGKPLEVDAPSSYEVGETIRIDPAQIQSRLGKDLHPSQRGPVKHSRGMFDGTTEDRIVLIIGFFLLIVLLVLLVLWVFS